MSTVIANIQFAGFAQKNTILQQTRQLDGTRCFLLKREGQTKRYEQNGELTSGYYVRFDDNRSEGGLFRYTTTDVATFRDTWAETHAIAYGVPASGLLEIYNFAEGEKDKIDPSLGSVYFAARLIRVPEQRHTIV